MLKPRRLKPKYFFLDENNFEKIEMVNSIFFSKGYMFLKVLKKIYGLSNLQGRDFVNELLDYGVIEVVFFDNKVKLLKLTRQALNIIASPLRTYKSLPDFPPAKKILQSSYISVFQYLSQELFGRQIVLCHYKDRGIYFNVYSKREIDFEPFYTKGIFENVNVFFDLDTFEKEPTFYFFDFYFKKFTYSAFFHELTRLNYPFNVFIFTFNQTRFDFVSSISESVSLNKTFSFRNPYTRAFEERTLRNLKEFNVINLNFDSVLPVRGSLMQHFNDIKLLDF